MRQEIAARRKSLQHISHTPLTRTWGKLGSPIDPAHMFYTFLGSRSLWIEPFWKWYCNIFAIMWCNPLLMLKICVINIFDPHADLWHLAFRVFKWHRLINPTQHCHPQYSSYFQNPFKRNGSGLRGSNQFSPTLFPLFTHSLSAFLSWAPRRWPQALPLDIKSRSWHFQ